MVTLLEEEKNFLSQVLQWDVWDWDFDNNNRCTVPQHTHRGTATTHQFRGFAMKYMRDNLILTENTVFVKLCLIDHRLGILNEDHIFLMAFRFFAFDVIQNNAHIQVRKMRHVKS